MTMSPTTTSGRAVKTDELIRQLQWRYATKKFDAARKISKDDWATLEQTLVLAPSSYGLQPWRFYVIENPKVREKLKSASWNQTQITDASHLVVFAIKKDLAAADVERFVQRIADVRKVPSSALDGYKNTMLGSLTTPRPGFDVNAWSARQAYIALGVFLTSAAVLNIDACPMEGFDPAQYDEILGLKKDGYSAVVVATAGYRAADAAQAKARFDEKHVLQRV